MSMRKTTWAMVAAFVGSVLISVVCLRFEVGPISSGLGTAALLLAAAAGIAATAGFLTSDRQRRIEWGQPDLYLLLNRSIDESAIASGASSQASRFRRCLARFLYGQVVLVGDTVRIRDESSIGLTVDPNRCTDRLPFMREMAEFSGRQARVYRVVDKVYDYGGTKKMRRLRDTVLLVGLRCGGHWHGGCEAGCYLLWKGAWLDRVDGRGPIYRPERPTAGFRGPTDEPPDTDYRCQLTELAAASSPQGEWQAWVPIRSLIVGNVTWAAFLLALLTRAFNLVQSLRGGSSFPSMPKGHSEVTVHRVSTLAPGDRVQVCLAQEIAVTLDSRSRHRGLWFDADMLKHCGGAYRVERYVTRIIDVKTRRLISMKNPCIVLSGVDYSGEFQSGGEQHEPLFWRDVWLK
jgi:hypothetical protein